MAESNPIFFHIGYPRTGTTFLQKFIFPQYADEAIFDLPHAHTTCLLNPTNGSDGRRDVDIYHPERPAPPGDASRPVIYSAEDLSGDVMRDDLSMPGRIKSMYPRAKIIVCLRSQYAIIPSIYSYCYIKDGGTKSYASFTKAIVENDKFNYYKLLKKYVGVFGEASVLVLFYETLKVNPELFLSTLFAFVGLEYRTRLTEGAGGQHRNPRFPLSVVQASRFLNCCLNAGPIQRTLHLVLKGPDAELSVRKIGRQVFDRIERLNRIVHAYRPTPLEKRQRFRHQIYMKYRHSNRQLFELLGVDPSGMGYPV